MATQQKGIYAYNPAKGVKLTITDVDGEVYSGKVTAVSRYAITVGETSVQRRNIQEIKLGRTVVAAKRVRNGGKRKKLKPRGRAARQSASSDSEERAPRRTRRAKSVANGLMTLAEGDDVTVYLDSEGSLVAERTRENSPTLTMKIAIGEEAYNSLKQFGLYVF